MRYIVFFVIMPTAIAYGFHPTLQAASQGLACGLIVWLFFDLFVGD